MEAGDSFDDVEPGPDRAFGFALVRQRKAEERDDAVAERREDITLVAIDAGRTGVFIGANDDLQPLGIELVGELGEADHVAEHHRQVTSFADRNADHGVERGRLFQPLLLAKQMDDPLARPERHADLFQVGFRQHAKRHEIDFVFLEDRGKTFEAVRLQPFGE